MPHVILKMISGRSERQKALIAAEITKAVLSSACCVEDAVSVSIEDVDPGNWIAQVYTPDIAGKADKLYKKPGYDPF